MQRLAVLLAALAVPSASHAEDLAMATPAAGNWHYAAASDGSEATFSTPAGSVQLWLHCMRSARRVTIARPASAAAPLLNVWSSSDQRALPSAFNPATGRLTADISGFDTLLDALANSRGRIAVGVPGQPSFVMPAWPEIARVVEDCRA